jgi:hypothetical protein
MCWRNTGNNCDIRAMRLHIQDVLVRAWQRGHSPEEIRPCLVEHLGDGYYEVDVNHPAYPREARANAAQFRHSLRVYLKSATPAFGVEYAERRENVSGSLRVGSGPGTELKKLLAAVGIQATPTCSCNAKAREMDVRGVDWCEANIDTIVGWLREEATKRKLPFVDMAGRLLVKRAIRNARRAVS